jgi:hypothetical protein
MSSEPNLEQLIEASGKGDVARMKELLHSTPKPNINCVKSEGIAIPLRSIAAAYALRFGNHLEEIDGKPRSLPTRLGKTKRS